MVGVAADELDGSAADVDDEVGLALKVYRVADGQVDQPGLLAGGDDLDVHAQFVAGALDQFAGQVNPSAQGLFASPFANLSFTEKGRVFRAIEGNPQTRPLVGVLALVAFLTYSEAPVLDPRTRTLRARPLGWTLSGYKGVADGRADFKGYYQDRMHVETRPDLAWR